MRTLVIIGGYAPGSFDISRYDYDKVVAADSGYDAARRYGIEPDLIVGDFDSTGYKDEIIRKRHKAMPKDKDETDTELALMEVVGAYDLLGGGEGRIDHTISILSLFRRYGYPRYWFTRVDTMVSISDRIEFSLPIGTELSLFAIRCANVTTKGLFWDIRNKRLDQDFLSLSNRMREDKAMIICDNPILLRISPEDFDHFRYL